MVGEIYLARIRPDFLDQILHRLCEELGCESLE